MGYTTDDDMVLVDFFTPSGKWYGREAVKWTGGYSAEHPIREAFEQSLRDSVGDRYSGMNAVCLEPCHELAHPLMVFWEG